MRHKIRLPQLSQVWYIHKCLQCELELPFMSYGEREHYMLAHESVTHHISEIWIEVEWDGPSYSIEELSEE